MRLSVCAALSLMAGLVISGIRAEPPAPDPLLSLNKEFRKTYARSRASVLARGGPVIVVDGAKLILLHGKERQEAEIDLAEYHRLKSVAHVPLTVYLLLGDTGEDDSITEASLAELRVVCELIAKTGAALEERGFKREILERQRKLLAASLAAADQALKRACCSDKERVAFARKAAPLLLANVADAARVQIDGYHACVSAWRRKLTADEWGKLRVVVMGSQMPRKQHLAVQYFARLLGETGEGRRIVYAEGLNDEKRALNLLGTHLLDREIAGAFFDDPQRMDRDLLSDAAADYLRALKLD
ncbi:MAG TPA: hypothetical protein VH643_25090 [Gemmataceae bacterium]|jgi:hypothetical protein